MSTANVKPDEQTSPEIVGDQLVSSQSDIIGDQSQEESELYWDRNEHSVEDNVETIMNDLEDTVEPIQQRIALKDSKTNTALVAQKFKVMSLVDYVLKYIRDPSNILEIDDKVPFVEGSLYSKGEVVRDWNSIRNKHLLTANAETDILNWLYNVAGHKLNLPVSLNKEGHKRLQKQIVGLTSDEDNDITNLNVISKTKNYVRKGSRWIDFHQCQNDCCVYVGRLSEQFVCPVTSCRLPRFRPCSRSSCARKGKDDCAHLISARDGVAYKRLYYRLLIPLIADLVNTEYFVTALHYRNECTYPGQENYYTEFLDGDVAKEHLDSMDKNYNAWRNENATNSNSVPVNLLLSQFYDGGQLFKWATCDFWGLFTSILNLPPTYRGKLGISTFLSALFSGKHNTVAEKFIFTDLYCEELRTLYEGFEYVGKNGQLFFIQARLIFHSMDTKAIEPVFKMKSMTGSRFGCPYCRSAHGQNNSWTTFFSGNRQFLSQFNYLRFLGQSAACCPHGFYDEDGNYFVDEGFQSSTEPIVAGDLMKKRKYNKEMAFCQPCDKDREHFETIKEFLRDENTVYEWHSPDSGFDFGDFFEFNKDGSRKEGGIWKYLFYRHFDFRAEKELRLLTKEAHLAAAFEARRLNLIRKRIERYFVDGFYDVWYFERLPYSDLARNTSFPPEHAIKGVIELLHAFVFGIYKEREPCKRVHKKRKKDDGTSSVKKDDGTSSTTPTTPAFFPIYRPSYHKGNAPYSCTTEDSQRCQAWLLCVLVPVGINDRSDWILNLKQTGDFKMNQWKIFILVYWDFILTALQGIEKCFIKFFQFVANEIRKLLSFSVAKASITQRQKEMFQMISMWEGLFPPPFVLHQLMHLVSNIPLFGAMHSCSEFFGEQALGHLKSIKTKTNAGGLSYERYIMNRNVDRELDTLERFYSKPVNLTNLNAANSTVNVSFDSVKKVLSFKVMQFGIFDPEKNTNSSLHPEEVCQLITLFLEEIRKRYDHNEDECAKESCLYRLVLSIEQYNKNNPIKNNPIPSFYDKLHNIVHDHDASDHFEEDELSLAKTLINFKPQFQSNARIYGLMFQSRGSQFREYSLGDGEIDWKVKSNLSSWCKFPLRKTFRYAKINAFFEVHIGDNSLDGLLIASVTSHVHTRRPPNLVDLVNHKASMDRSICFIALQEIYPTRIALVPFGENHLPIKINRDTKKRIIETKFVNLRTTTPLSYYYMCQMDSDKLSRMPEKRPFTMYLSSSSKRESVTSSTNAKIPSNCSTKFTFRSMRENGQKLYIRKITNPVNEMNLLPESICQRNPVNQLPESIPHMSVAIVSNQPSKIKETIFPSSGIYNASKWSNNQMFEIKPKYSYFSQSVKRELENIISDAIEENVPNNHTSKSLVIKQTRFPSNTANWSNNQIFEIKPKGSVNTSRKNSFEEAFNADLPNFNGRSSKNLSRVAADKDHEGIVDLCDSCSDNGSTNGIDNGSSIAVFPSVVLLPGCCKFCGKSPTECNPNFMGVDKTSSDDVRYSFPWRGNSCALDSVGSCLQMIFDNLTSKGKDIMEEYCPDLCDVFRNLSNGTITTFEAKEIWESLIIERLQTDHQNTFQKIRQHKFHSIELAYQLYLIRPPSLSAVSIQADTNVPSTFTSTFRVKPLCRNSCNTGLKQELLDNFSTCIRANIVSSKTFSDLCIRSSRISNLDKCQECGNVCHNAEYSQVQGALIIRILDHQTFGTASTLSKPVPDQIQFGETSYTLIACIYGNRMHFVSMVFDSSNNRILFHDGMANNAQFVERALDTFPG